MDEGKSFEVDVVAIHGLNGDAYNTWTHQKTKSLWLKDLLPTDIPGARVFTYQFPSHLLFSRSHATIYEFASNLLAQLSAQRNGHERRPIIFIAHSLGGIVCKQALLSAKLDYNYSEIFESTAAIIFFGTPHRGARITPNLGIFFGDIVDLFVNAAGVRLTAGKTRTDLLEALKANSPSLRELSDRFRHICKDFKTITIYEKEEKSPLRRLVRKMQSSLGHGRN